MHTHATAHKLTGIVANLLTPRSAQYSQPIAVVRKTTADGGAADRAAGVAGSDNVATPQPGKNSRPAPIAGPDEGGAAKVRPEASAHKRFGGKTLDALIEAQAALETAAQRVVAALDSDGDGGFTLAELRDGLSGKSGEAPGHAARTEGLFGRVDADGDGKVTLAELTALLTPKPSEPAEEGTPAIETAAADATSEIVDPAKAAPSA